MWAECGISYYGFSQADFDEESYYWSKQVNLTSKIQQLPNKIRIPADPHINGVAGSDRTIKTYAELLYFLCNKQWEETIAPLELFEGLNNAKKMVFIPPNKESDNSGKTNQRSYSKRLKKLDSETKRSIMDQIKHQGLNLDMLIGSSKKDVKAKMDWATKIAPLDSAIVVEFKCGESTASYKFNTIISLIDFLCTTDCTNF